MNPIKISLIFISLLVLGACQQQKKFQGETTLQTKDAQYAESKSSNSIDGQSIFTIQDVNGLPLVGAEVLIGMRLNDPFPNNFLKTDLNGQISLTQDWTNQPVTISYPGFIRTTFYGVNPGAQLFQLHNATYSGKFELKGKTTNFGKMTDDDNIADFGLVIQSLTREDLLSFDLSKILSSEMDTLSIAGYDAKIPSNVTFPKQVENYFIDVTIEKPAFRTYFKNTGKKKIYAIHGRFPFSDIVDEFKNNTPFPALINYFDFVGASIRDVEIKGNQSLDIPVNEIVFNDPVKVKTIQVPSQKTLISMTATETDGFYYPNDMKKMEGNSKTINFKTAKQGNKYLISALKRSEDFYTSAPKQSGISVTILPIINKEITQTPILDIIPPPDANAVSWKETLPKAIAGVEPLATYAALSHIQKFSPTVSNKVKTWEAYAPKWVSEMSLPEWPKHKINEYSAAQEFNSWEVTYLASNNPSTDQTQVQLGPKLSKEATHFSYNKKEFQ